MAYPFRCQPRPARDVRSAAVAVRGPDRERTAPGPGQSQPPQGRVHVPCWTHLVSSPSPNTSHHTSPPGSRQSQPPQGRVHDVRRWPHLVSSSSSNTSRHTTFCFEEDQIQGDPNKMPPTKMLITSTYIQRFTSYLVHINFSL